MSTILPIISMSDLQRSAKEKLGAIKDYALIQRHGKDIAFVLHPELGRVLLQTGMLELLKRKSSLTEEKKSDAESSDASTVSELDQAIGQVIHELSKR